MEENLQGIGKGLGNLKGMANQMNVEINRQNDQLDVINAKVGFNLLYIMYILLMSHILPIYFYHF